MPNKILIKNMAKAAITIQDASNLSGLVHSWAEVVVEMRSLFPETGSIELNRHPVNVLWAAKCADLCGLPCLDERDSEKYRIALVECSKLAQGDS